MQNLHFTFSPTPALTADGFTTLSYEGRDFWRAFLDTDEIKELAVYSHDQEISSVRHESGLQILTYDRLKAENGDLFDITLTILIQSNEGALEFSSVVENHSNVILNELQLPFVAAYDYGCKPEEEVFYCPDVLGCCKPHPREAVKAFHTEYMAADYKSSWLCYSYPPAANNRLSMPWMGLQIGDKFLYFGEHNPEMRIVSFNIGIAPRHAESELMFSISHFPAVHGGERVEVGRSVIALFKGDWRDGAAFYKDWSKKTWILPQQIPDWVQNITGWQRIILKHQYGEIYFKYEDLPRLYEEGKQYGLNALLVFGWWKGRFDNNYPEYEADPALGGEDGLRAAIAEVRRRGGHVLLYSNGNLIDVKTDFYNRIGRQISHKDIDGNEYREHYQFSNDGTILRGYGYKSFDTACHRTPEWKDNLLNVTRLKLSFGPDSIFFDQLGCAMKLCFDSTHPHGYRIDEDGIGRYENICAIREITPEDVAIGTEWVCDRYANLVDYIHGCGNAHGYSPSAYPDIYLHTFPGVHISNRFLHDNIEGFRNHLNYAFVYGMIFDVCIYRGRVCGIAGLPDYAEHVKYLIDIKAQYAKYFYHGNFVSMFKEPIPNEVRSAKFVSKDGDYIVAFWNTTGKDVAFNLYGKAITVRANDVSVMEYKEHLCTPSF